MKKLLKIILSILFISCLWDWSYGYYQLVRFLGMVGFGLLAYEAYNSKNSKWAFFYVLSAVLINPLVKISLGRELWNIVDVIWAVILLTSLIIDRRL